MGLGFGVRGVVAAGVMAAGLVVSAGAQAVTLHEPEAPLLPASFGEWKQTQLATPQVPAYSLVNANKDALEESGPERSAIADYARGGRTIHAEAIQFGDRTGAVSAFTLLERPGMRPGKELGASDAVGDGVVLFTAGSSVVLVNGVTEQDIATLKPLALDLPKVPGNKGVAPLLPTLVPAAGYVPASLRYALGPVTYAAEGGVLPTRSVGWEKNVEAVTAQYADKRGKETLTVLLYPTPAIAGSFAKAIKDETAGLGAGFADARVRREGPLLTLASGSFSGDEAQRMIENVHMQEIVATDGDMHPLFRTEAVKTYSLLANIAILSGLMMVAAVLLGLFLGVGRAWFRVLRGKPAAVEVEFLSLHLAPQNKAPEFEEQGLGNRD
jgi:hypothetical protein